MTAYMRLLVENDTEEYPRHVVKALLEMVIMTRLRFNGPANLAASPRGDHRLVEWQNVPNNFLDGIDDPELKIVVEEAKTLILEKGMKELSPEDLRGRLEQIDHSYIRAKPMRKSDQKQAGSREPKDGSFVVIHGFNGSGPQ